MALLRGSPDGKMKIYLRKGEGEFQEGEKVFTAGLSFSDPASVPIGIYSDGEVKVFVKPQNVIYVSVIGRERIY